MTSIASSQLQDRARRRVLRMLGAGAIGAALPGRLGAADPSAGTADFCTTPPRFDQRLRVPAGDGLLGYLRLTSEPIVLDAVARASTPGVAIAARAAGRDYIDPTLVVRRGTPVRIALRNALQEPTILHWHGLAIDTANDGNGETVALPGKKPQPGARRRWNDGSRQGWLKRGREDLTRAARGGR